MKAFTIITTIASLAYLAGNAQESNLVMNGSFESTDGKVSGRAQAGRADSISSSNNTTVDLYSKDGCGKDYDVPNNYMGQQESKTANVT
ncbi:MAG TPA: hypothetical protein VK826_08865 [Bacteroidia bacterium]|nr:hypothetical protein [Bacteroidia bacterium]